MPALVGAFGHSKDGTYSSFVQRLVNESKAKPVIITALMRKLIAIAQGVLKSQKPFDVTLYH